jgi:hypothetical protein
MFDGFLQITPCQHIMVCNVQGETQGGREENEPPLPTNKSSHSGEDAMGQDFMEQLDPRSIINLRDCG